MCSFQGWGYSTTRTCGHPLRSWLRGPWRRCESSFSGPAAPLIKDKLEGRIEKMKENGNKQTASDQS
ncbi:hypothetical protein H5410_021534 [Solanum commersonii]|uniref:Uncharacterized protein n=1 Tax=Solanum commersonii TaxID=4109 RepID=A0A9J5ZCV2_SOLCO|nr:hypothetical protein H5410_021534 [Solanum commersonii]